MNKATRNNGRGQELAQAIRYRIERRLPAAIKNLALEVGDGTIILKGIASSYYHVQIASQVAHETLSVDQQMRLDLRISVVSKPAGTHLLHEEQTAT